MSAYQIPVNKPPPTKYTIVTQKPSYYSLYPYFSFRYYDSGHKRYSFDSFDRKDFVMFVKRLKEISQYKWEDIFCKLRGFFHAHEVKWDETEEKKGFIHLPQELKEFPVCQFEIFKECRVFGFFNQDNVFKIVWVDRYHGIYPKKK